MIDVACPRLVDVRVASLRGSIANDHADLLLEMRSTRSGDFEDQRLQVAELVAPFLWIRRADAVECEDELAQEPERATAFDSPRELVPILQAFIDR